MPFKSTSKNTKGNVFLRTRTLVLMAMMVALMAVCSWINVPTAVPFTLQLFAVFSALRLLGGKFGTLSILAYILLGAVGAPVFAHFGGGIGTLFGPTGGYILGFLLVGLTYCGCSKMFGTKTIVSIIAFLIGLLLCYIFGTAWFMVVYGKANSTISLGTALAWCVIPFVPFDLAKLFLAIFIANKVKKFY